MNLLVTDVDGFVDEDAVAEVVDVDTVAEVVDVDVVGVDGDAEGVVDMLNNPVVD